MTIAAALALASALLHAGWNLIVKSSRDPLVFTWAVFVSSSVIAVPIIIVMGLPPTAAWPYLLASAVIQTGYGFALAAAYDRTDLSVAYPVARGTSPLLITVGAAILLDDVLGPLGILGVIVVSVSLITIAVGSESLRGVGWALVTGVMISAYTLVDTAGVRRVDESIRYVAALFSLSAVLMTGAVLLRRPRQVMTGLVRAHGLRMAVSGVLAIGAYGLVLTAARFGPIGLVAALRETSVVFGALAGWLLLSEPLGARRTVTALGVAVGALLLLVP